MNRATRNALASVLLQVLLVGFAVYVALVPGAFPEGTIIARAGVVALVFAVLFLLAELERLKVQLRTVTMLAAGAMGGLPRDDKAAIEVLIRALGSDDPEVRDKAHKNLVRLTGQELPPDVDAWRGWWADAKADFVPRGRRP